MEKMNIKKTWIALLGSLLIVACTATVAFPKVGTEDLIRNLPKFLPEDIEIELALNAMPKEDRSNSTVWALQKTGYVKVKEGSNGYHCMVIRHVWAFEEQDPDWLIPVCYDESGLDTVFKVHYDQAKFRAEGMSSKDIKQKIIAGIQDGTYKAPSKFGFSYMLSPIVQVPYGNGGIFNYKPHYMVYAPYITNKNFVGINNPMGSLPWVNNIGPYGMLNFPLGESKGNLNTQQRV